MVVTAVSVLQSGIRWVSRVSCGSALHLGGYKNVCGACGQTSEASLALRVLLVCSSGHCSSVCSAQERENTLISSTS